MCSLLKSRQGRARLVATCIRVMDIRDFAGQSVLQSPFSRVSGLSAKQMVAAYEERNCEQNKKQGASDEEGQQHPDGDPEQNKAQYFSHRNSSYSGN